jgi:hypothetical protein
LGKNGKKRSGSGGKQVIRVPVHGISYQVFAKVKWQRFLVGFSLVLIFLWAGLMAAAMLGKVQDVTLGQALPALLILLAILAIYRAGIRGEYRHSGLQNLQMEYVFDRDSWTVKSPQGQVTVLWRDTWRLRRNKVALLIYPNRKSVNVVPLGAFQSEDQIQTLISWATGNQGA